MRKILKALGDRVRGLLKGQRGFTLIELLVAVGIVAILAGIAVPMVTRFISTAEDRAQTAEWTNVQTAVDAMMAEQLLTDLSDCTTPATDETDMTSFPCADVLPPGSDLVLVPPAPAQPYIRVEGNLTECGYTAATDGTVSVGTCP